MTTIHLDGIVDDLMAIAAIPAPTFAEERRVAWLEERLRQAVGSRRRDGVGNLIWDCGGGAVDVLLTAHLDTVFDAATTLRITREDGVVRGPGVGDNAAAVAVALGVVERMTASGRPLPMAVAFTVGEEGLGNLRGAREAVAALAPSMVIALEGHGLDRVLVDAVGSLRARITVSGPGGHPWVDRGRPSALHALFAVGDRLAAVTSSDLVVNVGHAAGGRSVNSVADHAELLVEARSLEPQLIDSFEEHLRALRVSSPLRLGLEILGRRPAGRLDRHAKLLRIALEIRRELGLTATLDAGSTDANIPLAQGIPALALGVANGAEMHTPREWIDTRSLADGFAQLERLLERLLCLDGAPPNGG